MKIIGVTALTFLVGACSSSSMPSSPSALADPSNASAGLTASTPDFATAARPGSQTIVGIVLEEDGEFDVLQAAVVRAGLVEALNGTEQRTVFAPTDDAFVKTLGVADEAAAVAAIEGLPLEDLTNILLYHVTNGRRNSRSVLAAPSYQMLNGGTLTRAQLSAAAILTADISASNGIIHVINAVLLP
jgi:uncharacterized surface protein with fasciclin (FAS1) repeats